MTQNTSSAVMEQRAPRVVESDRALHARWRSLDFFPTPPWAARAGADLVRELETRRGIDVSTMTAWEPAAGEGHIAEPLREFFGMVHASDIHDYGKGYARTDFLLDPTVYAPDWIITNPPFLKAAEFVARGLTIAQRGVAVLCRLAFIESERRYKLLFGGASPLTVFAPFIERVPMQLGSWDPSLATATAYAWFVFHKHVTQLAPIIMPIAPGSKQKFWREDDARRFAARTPAPLLEGCAK